MSNRTALLLSIRPKFAEQIFEGSKTVELRRVRPRVTAGDLVIVYASGHTKALIGAFQVGELVARAPGTIWKRFGSATGLTKSAFDEYFSGAPTAFGITIAHTWKLATPVLLPALRKLRHGFRPPQGYHYLALGEVLEIGGATLIGSHGELKSIAARIQS
jgi:predicted transcriptional regulator